MEHESGGSTWQSTCNIWRVAVGAFEGEILEITRCAVILDTERGRTMVPARRFKETNVGFWNGLTVALTTAVGVLIWSGSYGPALIIATSMVLSMVIAGIARAAIPIVLTVLGQDRAQSSSIVLTTVTDVTGFFSFLGIATLLAGMI